LKDLAGRFDWNAHKQAQATQFKVRVGTAEAEEG